MIFRKIVAAFGFILLTTLSLAGKCERPGLPAGIVTESEQIGKTGYSGTIYRICVEAESPSRAEQYSGYIGNGIVCDSLVSRSDFEKCKPAERWPSCLHSRE